MNKKLLAAAVAAAVVAAPAAFADAVVYGKMHLSVDSVDLDSSSLGAGLGGDTADTDNWQVNSRASRLGFKGSEDLGNGLKAIYQIEVTVQGDGTGQSGPNGGSFGSSTRNTFVGLSGGWGTFLVGRHDTPDKLAFYATGNERLGDSILDLNTGSGLQPIGNFVEARVNNAIAYVSPNFSGFTLAAAVVPGEETGSNSADSIADHYSLALMYKGGGLQAAIGYADYDNQAPATRILNNRINTGNIGITGQPATTPDADLKLLNVGASYTFGMFSVGAVYQNVDIDRLGAGPLTGISPEYEVWAVTGKATFGNSAVSLVYTDSELDAGAAGDVEADGWGVAAEHNFSKRTKAYVAYANGDSDDGDGKVFSLGMIHDF